MHRGTWHLEANRTLSPVRSFVTMGIAVASVLRSAVLETVKICLFLVALLFVVFGHNGLLSGGFNLSSALLVSGWVLIHQSEFTE